MRTIESCQIGEFLTGTHADIKEKTSTVSTSCSYKDPAETLPEPPPPQCSLRCDNCEECQTSTYWWSQYVNTVDDLLLKSNVHSCNIGSNKSTFKRCTDNAHGTCKARFPCQTYQHTEVDPESGALNLKKGEAWINSVSPATTYLFRCNTDVTCLWSGTSLKAIIIYITDYITKTGLKTHVMFDAIKNIFDKHSDILAENTSTEEKARHILCKIANLLTTKTELGSPMICHYLLGFPDHYTSHKFVTLNWKIYLNEALSYWKPPPTENDSPTVGLHMLDYNLIATSPAHDYMHRPEQLQALNLYQWTHCYHKISLPKRHTPIDMEDPSLPAPNPTHTTSATPHTKALRFLRHHPLYNTHGCLPYSSPSQNVVNFIGGVPSRPDQADKDHYCATMLVVFKPWRSGKDLKTMSQSWENAFEAHNFMPREQQIIKNFNIRYECLDAHDDYHAQLKAGHIQPTLNIWNNNDFSSEINFDSNHPETSIGIEPHLDETSFQAIIDNNEMISMETNRIRSILHHTGWNNVSSLSKSLPPPF